MLSCLGATLRCDKVRAKLPRKKQNMRVEGAVEDWQMLIEALLQWERWLKSDKLPVRNVIRAKKKHRHLMCLIKRVGNRVKGMGLKITKFHCIMHLADDILNFGVPMEVDTGSNESMHKSEKTAAKLTQKNKTVFDIQTAKRLNEIYLLDLAKEEMAGKKKWECYDKFDAIEPDVVQLNKTLANEIGGPSFYTKFCEIRGKNIAVLNTKKRGNQDMTLEQDLINFVAGMQKKVKRNRVNMVVNTTYRRAGLIFRASTNFMGHTWRDWIVLDWGEEGHLPCHLMGFVDLSALSDNFLFDCGGMSDIGKGIYAIVECANYISDEDEEIVSEMFTSIRKEVSGYTGPYISHRKCYLADVEAIVGPVAVIPNLGAEPNVYLEVKSRSSWASDFTKFLQSEHNSDDYHNASSEDESRQDYQ